MAKEEKTSKVREIKETVLCAVEIMRQIKTPDVLESFGKIMDTGVVAKEIIESLKSPEMVRNIENFRVISENINESSTKMQNMLKQLEATGILNETKGLVTSAKTTVDSFGTSQDLHDMSTAIKDMFKSVRALVDGFKK
jgi:muramoyltetrapeptide carboxypeptidase LdcA involved in peptidoglycan recycling